MSLLFTKMHGLGNDFMVIDAIHQRVSLDKATIIALSQRDTGIGFDQCLLVEESQDPNFDFFYRIFNANGQEVGQCGNGARCLMRFIHEQQLSPKKKLRVATKTTSMVLELHEDNSVSVDFGLPDFLPAHIPLLVEKQAERYCLPLKNGQEQAVYAVNVGNPHAVSLVSQLSTAAVARLGEEISTHPWFPEETNAGFMEIIRNDCIHLRVFERGAGETKACGSGAVAAVAIGRRYLNLAPSVEVVLPGGSLTVNWPDVQQPIRLRGQASFVFEGKLCASSS